MAGICAVVGGAQNVLFQSITLQWSHFLMDFFFLPVLESVGTLRMHEGF